jgi:hypothetical protein
MQQVIGKRVKAYRNLNNGMIALRGMDNKVIGYCHSLSLKDCTVNVQIGTRNTIVRKLAETGKREKNVHAFIIGVVVAIDDTAIDTSAGAAVSYNPYKADHFYFCDDMKPFTSSYQVSMRTEGKGFPLITKVTIP